MATLDVMTFNLTTHTKAAMRVARLLMPLVWLRVLSAERATAIAMHFVKVDVTPVRR